MRDDQLNNPTPCTDTSVADMLHHIGGFPVAFIAAARKETLEDAAPVADGSQLEDGFRDRIARDLGVLADAWRDPAAYEGMTQAGPVELPGDVAALVALDEVVVHGWDLARATGQAYDAGRARDPRLPGLRTVLRAAEGRRARRRPVRPSGGRPGRRPRARPPRRRHRPRPPLDPARRMNRSCA